MAGIVGNVNIGTSVGMQNNLIYHFLGKKQMEKFNRFYYCVSGMRTLKVHTNWPSQDENLSWKPHISHIACKISKSIGIIGRSSPCLTKLALQTLYYSLLYPYFQYCISLGFNIPY